MAQISSPTPSSSSDNTLDESVDPNVIYSNFQDVVDKTQKKLADMIDSVSALNCQIASTFLDAVTLFDPDILSRLQEVETQGHKMDCLVASTQEMKKQLSDLGNEASKNKPIRYYREQLEQLGLLPAMTDD